MDLFLLIANKIIAIGALIKIKKTKSMKRIFIFSILIWMAGIVQNTNAQCIKFAENIGLTLLNTENFRHDGYLNSIQLSSNENIDVVKPFFAHKKYRIVVVADSKVFDHVNFKIVNPNNIVIYNNKSDDYTSIWEFTPQESQNFVISVQVPDTKPGFKRGCVAIITGISKESE